MYIYYMYHTHIFSVIPLHFPAPTGNCCNFTTSHYTAPHPTHYAGLRSSPLCDGHKASRVGHMKHTHSTLTAASQKNTM